METASAESVRKHVRVYVTVFVALMGLTLITVAISTLHLETHVAIIVALCIAGLKASLVAAFFMHLRHDKLFNTLAFLAAFLFLGIFILLTYDDLGNRGRLDQ